MTHRPRGLWLLVLLAAAAMAASRDDGRSRRSRDPRDDPRSSRDESGSRRGESRSPRDESRPSRDMPRPTGDESAAAPRAAPTAAPSDTPPAAPETAPAPDTSLTAPAATTVGAPGAAAVGAPVTAAPVMPAAAPAAAGARAGLARTWEDYRILTDRNIFVRNRTRPSSGRPPMVMSVSRSDQPVLTGIVQQGADCLAFFEDPRSGRTTFVQVGDSLGAGKVTAMTLDAIEYTRDGVATQIAIGRDLSGAVASLRKPAAPASTTAPASTKSPASTAAPGAAPAIAIPGMVSGIQVPAPTPAGPAAAPSDTTGSSEAAILERMRQRREQELQK